MNLIIAEHPTQEELRNQYEEVGHFCERNENTDTNGIIFNIYWGIAAIYLPKIVISQENTQYIFFYYIENRNGHYSITYFVRKHNQEEPKEIDLRDWLSHTQSCRDKINLKTKIYSL